MLTILLSRVHLRSLVPIWNGATTAWLAAAVGVTVGGIVLSALRWQRVLAALERPSPLRPLVSHYLAGLFVGNFLPSTIGGDVLRISRLSATNGDAPDTFASVALERLTGWIVLPVLTLAGLLENPTLLHLKGAATHVALILSIGTLTMLAGVLVVGAHPAVGRRFSHNEGWLRFVRAVHLGLDRFRRHPAAALEVLATGFAYQLAVVLAAFLAVRALDLDLGWTVMLAFMPAVAIVQVLPITIGGLGVREGAFVLFLNKSGLGVTTSQAITLGLMIYGVNLVASLAGAPAFAVGGRSPARMPA
jgi:uncharacterized protein (TIRG00374 family)